MTSNTMTLQEARDHLARKPKRNKFGAKKVTEDGILFDSLAEHRRYRELKAMEKAGEISISKIHPEYVIHVNGQKICTYEADFEYLELLPGVGPHKCVVLDVKGYRKGPTWRVFRLKAKLFEATRGYAVTVYPPLVKKPRKPRKKAACQK